MDALETEAPPSRGVDLNEEDGAQAVEYAMIGGLGAGLIGLLWTILSRTRLIERIVDALVSAVVELVSSWF